jgi:hypothetical protein
VGVGLVTLHRAAADRLQAPACRGIGWLTSVDDRRCQMIVSETVY